MTWEEVARVLAFQDHNTRVVVLGATLLGLASGPAGVFMLLRRRALVGDAVSHGTLPGIAAAFLWATSAGADSKSLPVLLAGGAVSALGCMAALIVLRRWTRLKEDAALGVVLSVSFGLGVALLGIVQKMPGANAAGLEGFIYGKTAAMLAADAWMLGVAALAVAAVVALFFKEFALLSFDPDQAAVQGYPVSALDALLMSVVVAVTVIGLQAVGLILMVAMLVIPAAAARFWTRRLVPMVALASAIGALSGGLGALASALVPRLPAGAVIVLVSAAVFSVGLALGPEGGILAKRRLEAENRRSTLRQHLLRALFEAREASGREEQGRDALAAARAWGPGALDRALALTGAEGLVEGVGDWWRLTPAGRLEARAIVRNHRLWELFLLHHADVAPSQVDRTADRVEHVLEPEIVSRLEEILEREAAMPASPHPLGA